MNFGELMSNNLSTFNIGRILNGLSIFINSERSSVGSHKGLRIQTFEFFKISLV